MIKFVISFLASFVLAGAAFAAPQAPVEPVVRGYVFEGELKDVRNALTSAVVSAGYVRTEETEVVVGWVVVSSNSVATIRRQLTFALKPTVAKKIIVTETSRFEMRMAGSKEWEATYADMDDKSRASDLFNRVEYALTKQK